MKRFLISMLTVVACVGGAHADDRHLLTVTTNPQPDLLPTLGVWQEHNRKKGLYYTNVSAQFPNVPDFTCDLWCYESPGIEFESARQQGGGVVELRHTWEDHDLSVVTTVIPDAGALEIIAHLKSIGTKSADHPDAFPTLNICWQLRRAAVFASEPDPYPEFVRRCFIFTEAGHTFLLDTHRRPIPVKPATHKRNNPPWVQMYAPLSAPDDLRAEPDG